MSVNTAFVNNRSLPFNMAQTANGNYTLPQHVYIPSPALQSLSGPVVPGPQNGPPSHYAAPFQLQRPYPIPSMPSLYGIRVLNAKSSPG